MLVSVMQREEESVRIFLLADEPWCPRPSANRFILTLHKRNHCVVARVRLQFKHKKLQFEEFFYLKTVRSNFSDTLKAFDYCSRL